jgi:chromosome segregation ATPase
MEQSDLSSSIMEMKLDIREIKTLMTEWEKSIHENRENIGKAAKEVTRVDKELQESKEDTHRTSARQRDFENRLEVRLDTMSNQLDALREALEKRSRELEKSIHMMSETKFQVKVLWITFTAALTGSVAAFVRLFTK